MPKYTILFPERPGHMPAVPPEDFVRKVQDLVRRSIELGQPPESLDPALARYIAVGDPFDAPDAVDEPASSGATRLKP
jgi:hypothetical protein